MTRRAAVVLAAELAPDLRTGPPEPTRLRVALCEDVYEVLAGLALLDAGIAARPDPDRADLISVTWPGAPVVDLPEAEAAPNGLVAAFDGLTAAGYEQAVVVSGDAPDLPGLLVGKLFRALGRAAVAVCPAQTGGLVAMAATLPLAPWVAASAVDLDTPDALAALRAAASTRSAVGLGPGWHRVRSRADLAALDPGLEGWAATRALLLTGGDGRGRW